MQKTIEDYRQELADLKALGPGMLKAADYVRRLIEQIEAANDATAEQPITGRLTHFNPTVSAPVKQPPVKPHGMGTKIYSEGWWPGGWNETPADWR